MFCKYKSLILLMIIFVLCISACEKKEQISIPDTHVDLSKIIKSFTADYLKKDEPIVIEINKNDLIKGKIGEREKLLQLTINPPVDGKLVWSDKTHLHFYPAKDFTYNQTYTYSIGLIEGATVDSICQQANFKDIEFYVVGLDIEEFNQEIIFSEQAGGNFHLEGKIKFTGKVDKKQLAQESYIEYNDNQYKLRWVKTSSKFYKFTSQDLKYQQNAGNLEFMLRGKALGLAYDVQRSYNIDEESVLFLLSSNMVTVGSDTYIHLELSDNIKENEPLRDYISIVPEIPFNIDYHDNIVRIYGDYDYNKLYKVTISKNLKSKSNKQPHKDIEVAASAQDLKPRIKFNDNGTYLSSSNNNCLCFQTINVKKIHYEITHIYANNICQFFQENNLSQSNSSYDFRNKNRTGNRIAKGDLDLTEERNIWLNSELDISSLIPDNNYGVYIVKLSFKKEDILYRENKAVANKYRWGEDPLSYSYYYSNGTISKPFIISDLALTCKYNEDQAFCAVTNVITGKPVRDAEVRLLNYQNQIIAEHFTDAEGICAFDVHKEPFLAVARFDDQESILKLSTDKWETSNFNTGGNQGSTQQLRAYIYTERGVYRPGDEVNFVFILRNQDGTFPQDHPVYVELFDPDYTKIYTTTLKNSRDGFYHLPYTTELDAPTGSWNLVAHVGDNSFNHELKVEAIAPERLKLTFHPQSNVINAEDMTFKIDLEARYLFGTPAAGLKTNFRYSLLYREKKYPDSRWHDFSFYDQSQDTSYRDKRNISTVADENGLANFTWKRPPGNNFSSAATIRINADVINRGGRASSESILLPWEPWDAYVGIDIGFRYINTEHENKIALVLLDSKGKPVTGENLKLKIYENDQYWWWEFNSYSEYKHKFKLAGSTRLVYEEMLISRHEALEYTLPALSGRNLLIEVTHIPANGTGHTSSRFVYNSPWARGTEREQENILDLSTDKDSYYPGDNAHLQFPISPNAKTLVTIEKGNEIVDWWWYQTAENATHADVNIAINDKMQPGIYASVSVIQPQKDKNNDCPLRLYGIAHLKVTDTRTIHQLTLDLPDIIRPQENFTCKIQADPAEDTQFTIAVVDEGLLSLTNEPSPDPWSYFYAKERLQVNTADNYDKFISLENGDIARRFSIGGGMEFFRKRQVEKTEINRFEPVSLFSGIISADDKGKAEVSFYMPNYLGAVRVMVVSACGERYGSIDKTVTVRKELMLLPTLPRALAPGDVIKIPVEVFAFEDDIKSAQVSISTKGPLQIQGTDSRQVNFNDRGEGMVIFDASMKNIIEPVNVTINTFSGNHKHLISQDIPVRLLQPYQLAANTKLINSGEDMELSVSADGIMGTESSALEFYRPGFFDFNKNLSYLMRYPYGCIEQTVSSVFPQLFITNIIDPDLVFQITGDIDDNIHAAFRKMSENQLPDGGFTYWRGGEKPCMWGTVYAAHFLAEAKIKGYHIPDTMMEKTLTFLQDNSSLHQNRYKEHLYLLYVLARSGNPLLNRMNFIHQNDISKLSNIQRWLLAGAYFEAGQNDIAEHIAKNSLQIIDDSQATYRYNYGSRERDLAIILTIANDLGKEDIARQIYQDLAKKINSEAYFSTQTAAFMLWALSNYANSHPNLLSNDPVSVTVSTENNGSKSFQIKDNYWHYNLGDDPQVHISVDSNSPAGIFTLYYDRVPATTVPEITNEFFSLKRELKDLDDKKVNPAELNQGETYMLNITVTARNPLNVDNIALTQILPSGWEIVNERLSGNNSYHKNADYVDIRDDRINWFFDLPARRRAKDIIFKVKFRAVTAGEFEFPLTSFEAMYSPDYTTIIPAEKVIIK